MKRQIRNQIRLTVDLLIAKGYVIVREEGFVHTHAARQHTALEELRRRRRQQLAVQRIDMQILVHIDTEIPQVDREPLCLVRHKHDVPVIQVPQIRLDILRAGDEFMPLLTRHAPIYVTNRHRQHENEDDRHARKNHVHDTRGDGLVTKRYFEFFCHTHVLRRKDTKKFAYVQKNLYLCTFFRKITQKWYKFLQLFS